jgi:hypothetical protein
VQKNLDKMNERFKEVMDLLERNSDELGMTIRRMQELIDWARQEQARSKKGHDKYQQIIDQYSDQLKSLKNQQEKILKTLDTNLAILRAPEGMKEYLSSIESIVKQYNQFVGAVRDGAEGIDDMRKATEFLKLSIDGLRVSMEDQWMSDFQGAINDALQLNDLIERRLDLVDQTNKQIQSVLSQGVLTRQRTRAQTIGSQVEDIERNSRKQLEQLNAQIQATTYRVDAENRIFGLATTRIGLEMQLVSVQMQQTDRDMTRIREMRELLNAIQQGNWNFGPLLALTNTLPAPANPQNQPPPAPAPYPNNGYGYDEYGTPYGPPSLEGMAADAYDERARYGYAAFRGQNIR